MDKESVKEINPCVSVLMPIYNAALYLRDAIDSILNQTYGNFELILLDDFSTDGSSDIIDSYYCLDERIIVYHGKENVGLANILNVGIKMARGKYIARMDSDDISLPDRLRFQLEYLESNIDVDLCSCAMKQFGASDRLMKYDNDTEEIKFNAMFYSPILHASSMWRKERFNGLLFEQEYVPAEDYRMWTVALLCNIKMVNIPIVLYYYRIYDGQATSFLEKGKNAIVKVRTEYIQMMFPLISQQEQKLLLGIPSCNDMNVLKESLGIWEKWNDKTLFITPEFLKKKLKRYYQARLYNEMKENGIIWSKLCSLRFKQIIKLFGYI